MKYLPQKLAETRQSVPRPSKAPLSPIPQEPVALILVWKETTQSQVELKVIIRKHPGKAEKARNQNQRRKEPPRRTRPQPAVAEAEGMAAPKAKRKPGRPKKGQAGAQSLPPNADAI